MKDGACPQCNERKVYWDSSFDGDAGGIATGFFAIVRTVRYVCTNCGFVGIYVANDEDLPKIEESKDLKKVN